MIYPKCKSNPAQMISITQYGYITPCCLFAGERAFNEIKQLLGDKVEQLHISSGSIDEINRSEAAEIITESFDKNPMPKCVTSCSRPVRPNTTPANGTVEIF